MTRRQSIWMTAIVAITSVAGGRAQAQDPIVDGAKHRHIVISIADRKLSLYEGDRVVKTWDVAVGKPSTPSPECAATIVTRIQNPTWYGPDGRVVGPGRSNPVGTRWIGLSKKGYGIHGTNEPDSIGKAASHGCIRMRNRDVEELFGMVETGMAVELVDSTAVAE